MGVKAEKRGKEKKNKTQKENGENVKEQKKKWREEKERITYGGKARKRSKKQLKWR